MAIPESLKQVIAELASLPTIGPRQATRLAFHLLGGGPEKIQALRRALDAIGSMSQCTQCYYYAAPGEITKLCAICSNPSRNKARICVVEKETDLISIETSRAHDGIYFVLGGPLNESKNQAAVTKARSRLAVLKTLIKKTLSGSAEEIIIAMSPTGEGDLSAMYLKKELEPLTKKISRPGRGIPTGGEIEFADEDTLGEAFRNRK